GSRKAYGIHVPAYLQKAQLLICAANESCADRSIRHGYEPVMSAQEIEQQSRQRPDRCPHVPVVDQVISHPQSEEHTRVLVTRGVADPVIPGLRVLVNAIWGFF